MYHLQGLSAVVLGAESRKRAIFINATAEILHDLKKWGLHVA